MEPAPLRRPATTGRAVAPGVRHPVWASSRGVGWSTRSGRSRSCRPTRSKRSTGPRCGSCPRSAWRYSATAPWTRSGGAGATVDAPDQERPPGSCPGGGAGGHGAVAVRPARPQPGAGHHLRRLEPGVRRGRRAGVRERPRPRPAGRQLRRLRRLRPDHRRARHHPPGRRRTAGADRPAGGDAPSRHVPDVRGRARQDVAVPRLRGRAGPRRPRCDLPHPRRRPRHNCCGSRR